MNAYLNVCAWYGALRMGQIVPSISCCMCRNMDALYSACPIQRSDSWLSGCGCDTDVLRTLCQLHAVENLKAIKLIRTYFFGRSLFKSASCLRLHVQIHWLSVQYLPYLARVGHSMRYLSQSVWLQRISTLYDLHAGRIMPSQGRALILPTKTHAVSLYQCTSAMHGHPRSH